MITKSQTKVSNILSRIIEFCERNNIEFEEIETITYWRGGDGAVSYVFFKDNYLFYISDWEHKELYIAYSNVPLNYRVIIKEEKLQDKLKELFCRKNF